MEDNLNGQTTEASTNRESFISTHLLPCLIIGGFFGFYFVLRYLGLWSENDTAFFVRAINTMQEAGQLDNVHKYPHGYTYSVWSTALSYLTGLSISELTQLYLPMLGTLFLSFFGYTAFRRLLGSNQLGLLAMVTLFLVPELVFTVTRGNHEKLTVALTLFVLFALLRSFETAEENGRWSIFAGWVIIYYLVGFTLVTTNVLFGSSFIVATTLTFLFASIILWFNPTASKRFKAVTRRLFFAIGISWLTVILVMWYVYPTSGNTYNLLSSAVEKFSALFLFAEPETSVDVSNPYAVVSSDWINLRAYRFVSSFRWLLFAGSFLTWGIALVYTLTRLTKIPVRTIFLLSLYGAFGFQLALAIPMDFLNLSAGSNLQVRMYTYFSVFAAPMFAFGMQRMSTYVRNYVGRTILRIGFSALVLCFALASLLKSTLDPTVSNRWYFYNQHETQAIRFWDERHRERSLWVGVEGRLRYAYIMQDNTNNQNRLDIFEQDDWTTHALMSNFNQPNALAWRFPPSEIWSENRVYDNGSAQLFNLISKTPF